MGETCSAFAWSAEPPKGPGDYLYAYRFNRTDEWTEDKITLGEGGYDAADDDVETLWFGPIPPLPRPVAGDVFKEYVGDVPPSPAPPLEAGAGPG